MVTGVVPSSPSGLTINLYRPSIGSSNLTLWDFSSNVLLTHPLALSASQFVHEKKSLGISKGEYPWGDWGDSNSRIGLKPGSRIIGYATGATDLHALGKIDFAALWEAVLFGFRS